MQIGKIYKEKFPPEIIIKVILICFDSLKLSESENRDGCTLNSSTRHIFYNWEGISSSICNTSFLLPFLHEKAVESLLKYLQKTWSNKIFEHDDKDLYFSTNFERSWSGKNVRYLKYVKCLKYNISNAIDCSIP